MMKKLFCVVKAIEVFKIYLLLGFFLGKLALTGCKEKVYPIMIEQNYDFESSVDIDAKKLIEGIKFTESPRVLNYNDKAALANLFSQAAALAKAEDGDPVFIDSSCAAYQFLTLNFTRLREEAKYKINRDEKGGVLLGDIARVLEIYVEEEMSKK